MERYILECATVDSMNRPRQRRLVGVFKTTEEVTTYMKSVIDTEHRRYDWTVSAMTDPAHAWVQCA
jgi:hypothetical protein